MFYSPINPYDNVDDPAMKNLDDDQRLVVTIIHGVIYFIAIVVAIIICALFHSCTTPRIVEEHHHHHFDADTIAVKAQVDRHLTSWHTEMIQYFDERLEQYSASLVSHEDQKEIITELITVTTDSIGREVRQEQRTITRDISRELQQQEQRMTKEYEQRLHAVADSLNCIYQQRYDSLSAHVSQIDSSMVKKAPSGDTRPWYQRWWSSVQYILIGITLVIAIYLTRSWWLRLLKK